MSDLNRFCCTGRLTRNPETRFLAGDKVVASMSLAVSRQFVANGERKEETLFLDCEAWGKLAEIIGQHLEKGRQVAVDGRIKMETWDDKATGQKRSKLKLVVDSMTFIGKTDAKPGDDQTPPAAESREAEIDRRNARAAAPRRPDEGNDAGDEPPF